MDDKEKVIEAFRSSEDPLNAKKVSEISGVEKKEVDKIRSIIQLKILLKWRIIKDYLVILGKINT